MTHLLQNNMEVGSDEDGTGLAIGWWFLGPGDGNYSVCFCMCSKFSISKKIFFFLSKIVRVVKKKLIIVPH